eukprot:2034112-Amphidinium_carterae.1
MSSTVPVSACICNFSNYPISRQLAGERILKDVQGSQQMKASKKCNPTQAKPPPKRRIKSKLEGLRRP